MKYMNENYLAAAQRYREKNKESIQARASVMMECSVCGIEYRADFHNSHIKSASHINIVKLIEAVTDNKEVFIENLKKQNREEQMRYKTIYCDICDKYLAPKNIKVHNRSAKHIKLSKENIVCDECGEEMDRLELQSHKDSEDCKFYAQRDVTCAECGKKIKQGEWIKHVNTQECKQAIPAYLQSLKQEITCEYCNKKVTKETYSAHLSSSNYINEIAEFIKTRTS